MITKALKVILASLVLASCGVAPKSIANQFKNQNHSVDTVTNEDTPQPLADEHVYSNFNYPVTICGGISATTKEVSSSEYVLTNGSIEVYVKTSATTDQEVMRHLPMLNGIFPKGNVSACLSGLNLPYNENGKLVFAVEKTIAIESGGFSVSN